MTDLQIQGLIWLLKRLVRLILMPTIYFPGIDIGILLFETKIMGQLNTGIMTF